MSQGIGRASAKLILMGEHAVVYGAPALGFALSRGVEARLSPGTGRIKAALADAAKPFAQASGDPSALVAETLQDRKSALDTELFIEVPPQSGLGTSAAIALAILRASFALDDARIGDEALLDRVIRTEHLAHGGSSGLDPSICLHEGLIRFEMDKGSTRIAPASSFHVVLGIRRPHGGTEQSVSEVRHLSEASPNVLDTAIQTISRLVDEGQRAIEEDDLPSLGHAIDLCHGILNGLGVVGDEVDSFVRAARAEGALGAKMSGAGGEGGAFFALAADLQAAQRIAATWAEHDAFTLIETVS